MPQIMTMSGQQPVSAAPLDLRTSIRGRVSSADSTPSNIGRPRDSAGVKAELPVHHRDCMNGTEETVRKKDSPSVQGINPESATEDSVAANGATVSRLPIRKRPYPAPTQSSTAPSPQKKTFDDSKRPLSHTDPLLHPYALCHWIPSGNPGTRVPSSYWQVQMHADVTQATHQDDDGDTPLHIAVVQGHEQMVRRLIDILNWAKKDVDIYNNMRQTPLHLTVITGRVDLVRDLLKAGADPGALDRNGQTSLHLCCEYNHASCLSAILSHISGSTSSCLETRNYEGLSPLHLAVQSGNEGLVKLLLKNGADINAVDNKSGRSPLMHAVEANNMEMVNLLIKCGCDVNAQSYSGNTALHSACGRGHVEAVRILLKNGADSSLKNYHNDTAVMVAKNKRVTDVLRGKGSRNMQPKTTDIQSSVNSLQHNTSHARQFSINGSSSPQYTGFSPVAPQHIGSHPHFIPVIHSPLGQAADSTSSRQSPVEVKERGLLQKNLGHYSVTAESHFPPQLPQPFHSIYTQSLSTLIPSHSAYSASLPGPPYHQEVPLLFRPSSFAPQMTFFTQSRPSSRSSDQSDVSTMSVNSDGKGESCLD